MSHFGILKIKNTSI